jgi:hypothetical protein
MPARPPNRGHLPGYKVSGHTDRDVVRVGTDSYASEIPELTNVRQM